MTAADKLLELAERCEKATGPDTELSFAIYAALNPDKDCSGIKRSQRYLYGEPYTASLDAAMTLYLCVPERVPANPRLAAAEGLRQRAEAV